MVALAPLYIAITVPMGRLMYTFSSEPGHIVRIGDTDEVNLHRALPVSTPRKGLDHLYYLAPVRILLFAPCERNFQYLKQLPSKLNDTFHILVAPTIFPRPYGHPASIVAAKLQDMDLRAGMAAVKKPGLRREIR